MAATAESIFITLDLHYGEASGLRTEGVARHFEGQVSLLNMIGKNEDGRITLQVRNHVKFIHIMSKKTLFHPSSLNHRTGSRSCLLSKCKGAIEQSGETLQMRSDIHRKKLV